MTDAYYNWKVNYFLYEKYTFRQFKCLNFKEPSKVWLINFAIDRIIEYLDQL